MITIDISNLKVIDRVEIICDICSKSFERTVKNIKKLRKKSDIDFCLSCSAKNSINKKPQCSKEYWESKDVKEKHSNSVKNSDKYITALSNRDNSGEKNPMYGKSHKIESIKKMSISRTGKIGENATAWKGGKLTITRMVKGYQNRNDWYKNIYKRDSFRCVKCNSNKKIEAHHILPVKNIVDSYKDLFTDKYELYNFLIKLDIINDVNLNNGITLCRECHKLEHSNFGSHFPKILQI